MKKYIVLIVMTASLFVSCGTQNKIVQQSVNSNTKVTVKETLVRDTVYVEIPAQQAEITTRDSLSFLETDFAASTARINKDGTLYHDIMNKPQKKPVEHFTPVMSRDSLIYIENKVIVPVPVERELTFWERISIKYFKLILPILGILVCWLFRKPILSFVRRFI